MKTPLLLILLTASLLILFESCSVQDHLVPESKPDPYNNFVIMEEEDIAIVLVPPGSSLQVGDEHPGKRGFGPQYGKVNEIIEIDGQKYALAQGGDWSHNYYYDAGGKIIKDESRSRFQKGVPTYEYAYSPGKIIQRYQIVGLTSSHTTTYDLNAQGIIPANDVIYDSEGYEIERNMHYNGGVPSGYKKTTVLNGNAVRVETKDNNGEYVTTNEFDLTKPNLPNLLPFAGKKDRNLIIKSTVVYNPATAANYSFPKLLTTEYRYTFDIVHKVMVKIWISTYEDGSKGLSATLYKYLYL